MATWIRRYGGLGNLTVECAADCPVGSYCPPGTAVDRIPACPAGTFQNASGRAVCMTCLAGMYCAPVKGSDGTITQGAAAGVPCEKGYACPAGSSAPKRCPEGYIANSTKLAQCTACPAGRFEQNRQQCLDCKRYIVTSNAPRALWNVLGHSLGGAMCHLACCNAYCFCMTPDSKPHEVLISTG